MSETGRPAPTDAGTAPGVDGLAGLTGSDVRRSGTIPSGVPGVTLSPGDHICAFYRGTEQRDDILLPFLREALLAGDKCICALDAATPRDALAALEDEVDLGARLASGQFDLLSAELTYLARDCFSVPEMLEFWEAGIGGAVRSGGFGFVRAVGEMTWALREAPGVGELLTYEAGLNDFLPRYPQVILCLYDLERFTDGRVLLDLLRTHPFVLLGGQLLENPWYMEPAEFLAGLA